MLPAVFNVQLPLALISKYEVDDDNVTTPFKKLLLPDCDPRNEILPVYVEPLMPPETVRFPED